MSSISKVQDVNKILMLTAEAHFFNKLFKRWTHQMLEREMDAFWKP